VGRADSASALRAPALLRQAGRGGEASDGDDGRPRLRLVVVKGRLAVELERPFAFGPLVVRELALSLPDVRFPVDLSGGVDAFRHHRGVLDHLAVALEGADATWASDLRALFGAERVDLVLAPNEDGWLVGVRADAAALAFEVALVPAAADLRLVPFEARGVGLGAPPHELALAVLAKLTREIGRIVGGAVVVERAAREVTMALLPLAGMRAPATDALRWGAPTPEVGALALRAGGSPVPASTPRAIRAVEAAALAADGDDACLAGDRDEARRRYLEALERAPRHPELVRRVAELDRLASRPEVGLGVLADLGSSADAELLEGELFALVGKVDAAASAFERAALAEPFGPLASLAWVRFADLADGPARLLALDRAVARSPSVSELRWRRFEARLAQGDVTGALADAADLEVSRRGSEKKYEVAHRVAESLLRSRHLDEAATWFERALRYRPDSPLVLAGLARVLDTMGEGTRALELHQRAIAVDQRLARKSGRPHACALLLDFAKALAAHADDRPAAIAHVRSIPASRPESFEARLLEGRWCAELGDTARASVAFARLGDEVERALGALASDSDGSSALGEAGLGVRDLASLVSSFLEEAANVEEFERSDRLAARRLLSLALRLAPQRRSVKAAFRRVAAEPKTAREEARVDASAPASPLGERAVESDVTLRDEDDELLVERLSERLRANPSDSGVVLALADALDRLGRDHELLALLSARIDEEGEPLRSVLLPRRRVVLERMRDSARVDGRDEEAELYALLLTRE